MANETVETKEVSDLIEVNGKEYKLRFNVAAIIRLKKEHGIKLADLQDEEVAQDLETIIALAWAGLSHNKKAPSFDDLAESIELHQLQDIAEKVSNKLKTDVKKD